MNHKLNALWPKIILHQEELRAHPFRPLQGLAGLESEYGLAPLKVGGQISFAPAKIPAEGKLADLTASDLLELRAAIYAQTPAETLRPWGEKLLRYAEIKFPAVETLHESLRLPVFAAAMLTSFFMDYFAVTGDYRFLNVALKLLDYQNARGGCRGVGPGLMSLVVETLHCRNHMLAESALKKL